MECAGDVIKKVHAKAKNTKIVGLDGPPCPRCGCPTEIREHERITAEEWAKSFYYSRWYNCRNRGCKTTAIMPDEFKVWKNKAQRSQDVVTMPTEHHDSAEGQVGYIPPNNAPSSAAKCNAVFVKNGFKASVCLECGEIDLIPANESHKPCIVCGAEPARPS